jgi:endonuclease YncB( thermonuclease family)
MDPAGNLRSDIQRALDRQRLTQWQRTFLTDIHARLERSDGQAKLSDKQWQKVFEILGPQTDANRRLRPLRTATLMPRFRPRRRFFSWRLERLVFGFAIIGIVAAFQMFAGTGTSQKQPGPAPAAIGQPVAQQFTVTDGDTVHVAGEATGTRLVGFNTPEKFSPQCASERQLGERASARLKELVGGGATRLTKVACSCAPGTEGTEKCNHGRSCGRLLVDGEDVGNILIREGLAVPFVCSGSRCPATPRPWCG